MCKKIVLAVVFIFFMMTTVAIASPAIYYSPHPDDETWGMAHSIRKHKDAGREVYVVLLTDGENSAVYNWWITSGYQKDWDNDGDIDRFDFGLARREEFRRATYELGVDRCYFYGGENSGFYDGALTQIQVKNVMQSFEQNYPKASHKTTMKYTDGLWNGVGDLCNHPDHLACCDALKELYLANAYDARFYKVYVYFNSPAYRWSPLIETATENQHYLKQRAMYYGYGLWSPPTYLMIGKRSMGTTYYGNCAADYKEYCVFPWSF